MAEYNARLHVKTDTGYDDINLETKANIVKFNKDGTDLNAINTENAVKEVNTKSNTNKTNIGVLSSLKTSIKTNIVNAINNLYDSTIGKTLKTLNEVSVATQNGYFVDALAIKEFYNKFTTVIDFTPELQTASGRKVGYTEEYAFGQYSKIGKLVFINIRMKVTINENGEYARVKLPVPVNSKSSVSALILGQCYNLTEDEPFSCQLDTKNVNQCGIYASNGSFETKWKNTGSFGYLTISGFYYCEP